MSVFGANHGTISWWASGPLRMVAFAASAALLAETALVAAAPVATAVPVDRAEPTVAAAADTAPLEAPDEASASLTARLRNVRVEVLSARTETTTLWANPDGTFTIDQAASPIRVQSGDSWKPVDLTLQDNAGVLTPKASAADVQFFKGGNGRLAKLTLGSSADAEIGWKSTLPVPTVSGGVATYPINSKLDLQLATTATGYEANVLVKARPAASPVWRLPLKMRGLTLAVDEAGGISFTNAQGRLIGRTDAPRMWDSQRNVAGDPSNEGAVSMRLEPASNPTELVLTPDPAFIFAASTQYPVTVDPTFGSIATVQDTYVTNTSSTSRYNSHNFTIGTNDSGTTVNRAFLQMAVPDIDPNAVVTEAHLRLYQYGATTCTPTTLNAFRLTANITSSTVWSNQPAADTSSTYAGNTASFSHGPSGCGPAFDNVDVTKMVNAWALNVIGNPGIALRTSETNNIGWKVFCSKDYNSTTTCPTAATVPTLSMTYNTTPDVPTKNRWTPSTTDGTTSWTNSLTPTFSAFVTDPDGGQLRGLFDIAEGTTAIVSAAQGDLHYSGGRSQYTVPTGLLVNGHTYKVRVAGFDGSRTSAPNGFRNFVVDTTAPTNPTISSTAYPNNTGQWSGGAGTAGNFTLTPTAADNASLNYWLDDAAPTTVAATTTAVVASITPPSDGPHTLHLQAVDKAGNTSSVIDYTFNVGNGAVLNPIEGSRTDRRYNLALAGRADLTGATLQFRRGPTETWTSVPAATVTNTNNVAISSWPVALSVSGSTASVSGLRWDAAATLSGNPSAPIDGALEVRGLFTGPGSPTSSPVNLVVDQQASAAASEPVGPGALNLLTGDYSLSDDEGGPFGLAVTRSTSSRNSSIGNRSPGFWGPFGPQWAVGGSSDEDADNYQAVRVISTTSAEVILEDATTIQFVKSSGTGGTTVWEPEIGSEDLALTGDGINTAFTLTDTDDAQTVFKVITTAGTTTFPIETSTPARTATANTSRYSYESATIGGQTRLRLRRLMAPTSAVSNLATCDVASPPTGCRVLELVYSPNTTTPPATGTTGAYPDRVSSVKLWATAPAPGATGTTATTLGAYAYDDQGRLVTASDPRTTGLSTSYGYDSAGHVTSLTPAGKLPWQFAYANLAIGEDLAHGLSGDTNPGRLTQVSRAALAPGTKSTLASGQAKMTVVYAVPLSGTGAPRDLTQAATSAWGQTGNAVPSDATAIFPADSIPTGNKGAQPTGGWARADVTYLDVSGRETNSLDPGNHLDFTAYDQYGNTVQELSAANLELALSGSDDRLNDLGLKTVSAAIRAEQLSEVSVYELEGKREKESFGPLHVLTATSTSDGAAPGRTHTENLYDQSKPANSAVSDLVTTTMEGARMAGAGGDIDIRTTTTDYDWNLGLPTTVTSGGLLSSTTNYDSQGRVIKVTPQGSSGSDARAVITTFYTVTPNASLPVCGNRPEWADLVCQTAPAATIVGSTGQPIKLPTKVVEYNQLGSTDTVTEISADASNVTTSRVTDTDFDAADRPVKVSITGGLGTLTPVLQTNYDTATGEPTASSSTAGSTTSTITKVFDDLGRQLSYTDADGATSTTSYDILDRVTSRVDWPASPGAAGTTSTTTSWAYDMSATGEPRGLPVSSTDSVAGTFTGTYDGDGTLVAETLKFGSPSVDYTMALTIDPTGTPIRKTWTQSTGSKILLDEQISEDAHGLQVSNTGQATAHTYGYDAIGRLTSVEDTKDGQCRAKGYGFVASGVPNGTNRLYEKATSWTAGACPSGPSLTGTADHSYDSADRIKDSGGYSYDAFGRSTATPGTASISYYTNDLVQNVTKTTGDSSSWSLDPGLRQRALTRVTSGTTTTKVNHYTDDGDSPDWISEGVGTTITRNVTDLSGNLVANTPVATSPAEIRFQLTNLHGDVVQDINPDGSGTADLSFDNDEWGNPVATQAGRYGWLGGKQRSRETPNGLVLMGVRLYSPTIGRFLQTDPIFGGSSNAYEYCNGDPINCLDLSGRWGCGWCRTVAHVAEVASFIPGPIGMIASGIAVASYVASGCLRCAGGAALGFIPGAKIAGRITRGAGRFGRASRAVVGWQARSRYLGTKSRAFGVNSRWHKRYGRGGTRIGWSRSHGDAIVWRYGRRGRHHHWAVHRSSARFSKHWK